MLILVNFEESQTVTIELRARGHEAYSCDLEPCSGGHPEWHLQMDAREAVKIKRWEMMIAHPPCTRMAQSGWWYVLRHGLQDEVREAAELFKFMLNYTAIPKRAIESSTPSKLAVETIGRRYDQIIQPYEFGENAKKKTCLWLVNLPPLMKTAQYPPRMVAGRPRWGNQTDGGFNRLPPSPDRAKLRSKTYPGIAKAMAEQWT